MQDFSKKSIISDEKCLYNRLEPRSIERFWVVSENHGDTPAFVRKPPPCCQANPGHRSQFLADVLVMNGCYELPHPPIIEKYALLRVINQRNPRCFNQRTNYFFHQPFAAPGIDDAGGNIGAFLDHETAGQLLDAQAKPLAQGRAIRHSAALKRLVPGSVPNSSGRNHPPRFTL